MKVTYTHTELKTSARLTTKIAAEFVPVPAITFAELLEQLKDQPGVTITDTDITFELPEEKTLALLSAIDAFSDSLVQIVKIVIPLISLFKHAAKKFETRVTDLLA